MNYYFLTSPANRNTAFAYTQNPLELWFDIEKELMQMEEMSGILQFKK